MGSQTTRLAPTTGAITSLTVSYTHLDVYKRQAMDYMKETKEISAEEAIILWQASRLSLSKSYEKAPEILKVHDSVIGG